MTRSSFPPVPDVARFDLLMVANDGVSDYPIMNRVHVFSNDGWTNASVAAAASDVGDEFGTTVMTDVSVEATLVGVRYKDLTNPLNVTGLVTKSVAGGEAGDAAPYSACAVVRGDGTLPQRPTRGYWRHGPLPEAKIRGNHLDVTYQGSIETQWTDFVAAVLAIDPAYFVTIISVLEPKANEPPPDEPYRDTGIHNVVDNLSVRRLLGRSVSRLD